MFYPIFFLAALGNPHNTAIAGAIVFTGRVVSSVGYWFAASARAYGAWYGSLRIYNDM